MENIKTYLVNLPECIERRNNTIEALSPYAFVELELVEAFDGRLLNDTQKKEIFNSKKYEKIYNREVRGGEIGCTLSHQECYRRLVNSRMNYALIVEDDIIIREDLNEYLKHIITIIDCYEPMVILLSGMFYFGKKHRIASNIEICNVIDGFLTHSYLINKAAAQIMLTEKPYFVADAWPLFKKMGVNILGIRPHPIDQDWSSNELSTINNLPLKYIPFKKAPIKWLKLRLYRLRQEVLKLINHFENYDHGGIR